MAHREHRAARLDLGRHRSLACEHELFFAVPLAHILFLAVEGRAHGKRHVPLAVDDIGSFIHAALEIHLWRDELAAAIIRLLRKGCIEGRVRL